MSGGMGLREILIFPDTYSIAFQHKECFQLWYYKGAVEPFGQPYML